MNNERLQALVIKAKACIEPIAWLRTQAPNATVFDLLTALPYEKESWLDWLEDEALSNVVASEAVRYVREVGVYVKMHYANLDRAERDYDVQCTSISKRYNDDCLRGKPDAEIRRLKALSVAYKNLVRARELSFRMYCPSLAHDLERLLIAWEEQDAE